MKKTIAGFLAAAMVIALMVVPAFAGEIMPYVSGAEFSLQPPVVGQTVAEVNKTLTSEKEGFKVEKIYWVPDFPLPTVLPSGETTGNIQMGANGLECKGKTVSTMKDTDVFQQDKNYLVILEVSSTKGILGPASELHLNGKDLVYEGYADEDHTGVTLLFAKQFKSTDKEVPQAVFAATGYDTGLLGNIHPSMQYSIDGVNWINCGSDRITLSGLSEGTLEIRYADSTANVQVIQITRASVPDGITSSNCTSTKNNDGIISGLSSDYEMKKPGETSYQDITEPVMAGLPAGQYLIRTKADGNQLASGDVKVNIAEGKAKLPKITAQPTSEVLDTGAEVMYITKAEGEGLTYEWHYIDYKKQKEKVIEKDSKYFIGQGTDTIIVKSVNKMKTNEHDCEYTGDQFYCIVSNEAGSVKSDVVTYTVNHVAEKEWKTDSGNHWQLCECGKILNKTAHVDADKDGKCDVCKFDMSNSKEYKILSGNDTLWKKGSTEAIEITCDGKAGDFKELLINEKTVEQGKFGLSTDEVAGNLVVTIPSDYLEELTEDSYTVTLKFVDGSVSAQFTIDDDSSKDDPVPDPAPTSSPILWIIAAIAAIAVIVVIVLAVVLAKNKKQKDRK
ncbi:MAG: hypothetical protein MJ086_01270 [Lachnospiraceae bacterium]|nr:hypothetical protein [Lachnospiraceae bacterium]